ncbi:MAG: pitrilysin family protein [Steroidobacteraceae bacterium]
MTRRYFLAFACAASLAAGTPARAGVANDAVRIDIGGIDLVVIRTDVKDVVTLAASLRAGDDRSPADNSAIATLTGEMLDKGTTRHDKFAIAQTLGGVGARLGFGVGSNTLSVSGRSLSRDLPLLVSLMAEQLREPAFPEAEFAKLKKQIDGSLREQMQDTDFRADDAFSRAVFPPGHPNRSPTPEQFLADVGTATLDQLRQFHARYYGPTGMRIVIVGDVDPAVAGAEVRKAFAGWQGGSVPPPAALAPALAKPAAVAIEMPDKTSVSVLIGQPTRLRYADADTLPLSVGTRILGSGFTGRLMSTVRDKEGLTYGVGAGIGDDTYADGYFEVYATFAPGLLERGIVSTRRELELWHAKGVTAGELARAKTRTAGSYVVGLATSAGLAGVVMRTLEAGLPLEYVDQYPDRVAALTLDQVNGAIRRHLDPSKMVLVEAGTLPAAKPAQR